MSCMQLSSERDGKVVDAKCHTMTASHIRSEHKHDSSVPVCSYYEVTSNQTHTSQHIGTLFYKQTNASFTVHNYKSVLRNNENYFLQNNINVPVSVWQHCTFCCIMRLPVLVSWFG